jgi:hypothetical protein
MTIPTLREYLRYNGGRPAGGLRAAALPFKQRRLSMRSLLAAPRIIHISDLHFTDRDHTWDRGPNGIYRDHQNSKEKSTKLQQFLNQCRNKFGTTQVVITGDLTDSGGERDYPIARDFISSLTNDGFQVSVLPGNHDYCWEGNLFFEDVFKAVLAISKVEIAAAVALALMGVPPWDAAVVTQTTIGLMANHTIASQLAAFLPGVDIPAALIGEIAMLFTFACPILAKTTDTVDNAERRRRFIRYLAPDQTDYPKQVEVSGGALLLLDSMQGQLDGPHRDALAQGCLGTAQLTKLQDVVTTYQPERARGKKLVVCLHHSPLYTTRSAQPPQEHDSSLGLNDADELLDIITGRIDGLLFGHTTPIDARQQPRPDNPDDRKHFYGAEEKFQVPILNCENLEHTDPGASPSCPVTVVDLGSSKRATYDAFAPDSDPVITWGSF